MTDIFLKIVKFICAGVCHGLPERCLRLAGIPLNLCSRCTGTYLGFFFSSLLLLARKRLSGSALPEIKYIMMLILFPLSMPLQYVLARTNLVPDYQYRRTLTGALSGIFLAFIVYPCLNMAFFGVKNEKAVLERPSEFLFMVPVAVMVFMALLINSRINYYVVGMILSMSIISVFTLAVEFFVLALMEKSGVFKYPLKNTRIIIISFAMSLVIALVFLSVLSYVNTRFLQSLAP